MKHLNTLQSWFTLSQSELGWRSYENNVWNVIWKIFFGKRKRGENSWVESSLYLGIFWEFLALPRKIGFHTCVYAFQMLIAFIHRADTWARDVVGLAWRCD
jgi:hypothetical protein